MKAKKHVNFLNGLITGCLAGLVSLNATAQVQLDKSAANAQPKSTMAKAVASNRVIVRFQDKAQSQQINAQFGAEVMFSAKSVPGMQIVKLPSGKDLEATIAAYNANPAVLYAEPDYLVHIDAIPNDTSFSQLWGMNNTGQTGGTPDADINAPEAWDITTGSTDVVLAVIDTGFDYTHPDLAANAWTNPNEIAGNLIDDDGNGYVDDVHGIDTVNGDSDPMDDNDHGTHVSGTIGGTGNNALGVAGVNWNVRIAACKFLSASGSGSTADAVTCMDYFWDLKVNHGINIVASNNSWGGGGYSQALYDAIAQHMAAGILFDAAAGNDGLDLDVATHYPSSYFLPNIIAVAATTDTDARAGFSNYGLHTVHVGAPGQNILSTIPGGSYASFNGTSMATPHVTGLVGLLKAQDPSRSWTEIRNLVISSGTTVPSMVNTVSGKRIRAADVGGTGALTCNNQTLQSRLKPIQNNIGVSQGDVVDFSVLNIDCANPAGDVPITIVETGDTVTLLDNGAGTDQYAGDGVYSGQVDIAAFGLTNATLQLPNGDSVTVQVVQNYLPAVSESYNWRDISAVAVPLITSGDDVTTGFTSPFPIHYANDGPGYGQLAVASNGYIIMQRTGDPVPFGSVYSNPALPYSSFSALVSPFWDDLLVSAGVGQVSYGVLGTAPNRELVVEWNNIGHFGATGEITFQVVFFENGSDVVVNYQDVVFGNVNDFGASATVGVQVSPTVARQYSYNSGVLSDLSSKRWSMAPTVVDTDGDGVPDDQDNCTLVPNPAQIDTDGDFYGNMCDPDFNNDLIVNATDLGYMKANYFGTDPDADLNSDGFVNAVDLGILKQFYFLPPGPSGTAP